ncbi:hypothetical protein C1X21_28020 [Pseudomonas sp. FW305-3-2-15-A-LB2]|nr:hypothetical protein C1X17_15075 [Pseudomonas sp. FW305-3-2-15-C-TSA2]PMV23695.1 hypothetical protein C1X22_22300 [Pseudomonas sp. DP16D-L5]PMV33863.1 hypothetical protein C1X21_28020 [Pseudomonas sp. FW305-3-2-15-A-LB2]PMV41974.1 hypothetical protein C1X16_23895 [Pseudomonas sp. FW305-3-2-15-C-R2A1]PMV43721.1 hypothetical protein C1X18_27840 [Pseudomonas sp. FW305-3-2-15-C-LB1]PMV52413.1 hypothetical protein C1X19_22630 [Pseudomonas sp. GW460-4]PMV61045.1 hypothetical protein C1X20_20175 
MADYQCHPLWNMSPDEYGDIAPCGLPISEELQLRLSKWAAIYDETLNADYPPNSGFKSEELEREFKREGERLAECLRNELGPDFSILFKLYLGQKV